MSIFGSIFGDPFQFLVKEGETILAQFIDIAEAEGMPVKVLRHVKKGYSLKPYSHQDLADLTWNVLHLRAGTVRTLRESSKYMADAKSVGALYHESTHAYLDLTDDDEASMFKAVMSEYNGALLKDGTQVSDPHRVAHEAAAMYVQNRATAAWQARNTMVLLKGILDDMDSGEITAAEAGMLIEGQNAAIPLVYNQAMKRQVFGYQETGSQVEVAITPIPKQLKDYCDDVILEGKIKNDFALMKQFHLQYDKLLRRLLCFRNSPATAGGPVMNFCSFPRPQRTSR